MCPAGAWILQLPPRPFLYRQSGDVLGTVRSRTRWNSGEYQGKRKVAIRAGRQPESRGGVQSGRAAARWTHAYRDSVEPCAPCSGQPVGRCPSRRARGPCAGGSRPPGTARPGCGAGRSRAQRAPASGRGPVPAGPRRPRAGSRCSGARSAVACGSGGVPFAPGSGGTGRAMRRGRPPVRRGRDRPGPCRVRWLRFRAST